MPASRPSGEAQRRWRGVEARHFATLAAVAETGSFRAAASRRGYVPSSVSQQIAELERLVGAQLVERRRGQRRVELTPAGLDLAERGRSVVASFEAAQVDLEAARSAAPEIRLSVGQALVDVVLPPLARALAGLPDTVLVVGECADEDEPARLVEAGVADLGVGAFPVAAGEVEAVVLAADPYELLVRATDDGTPLTHERLAAMRLVIPAGSPAACPTAGRLGSLGIAASRTLVAHPADVASLVRAGAGAGVVTRSMRWSDEDGLTRVPAHHLLGTRALAGMWHRRRHLGAEAVPRFMAAVPGLRRALAYPTLDVPA